MTVRILPRNDCQVLQDHKFRLELLSGHGLRHVGPKTIVLVSGHLFGTVVRRPKGITTVKPLQLPTVGSGGGGGGAD